VRIHTRPEAVQCVLTGQGGFTETIVSPATVAVPRDAAPVTVACVAPGYRRTVATLTSSPDGWVWGNSALIVVSGGVAFLGMAVDEAVGSMWDFSPDFTLPLDEAKRRPLTARQRGEATELKLGQ